MLIVFVLNDIYYLLNRKRMSVNLSQKDVMSVRHLDLVYYFVKVLSLVWPLIGIFGEQHDYFLLVIAIWILRFLLYHLHKGVYAVYSMLVPLAVCAIYVTLIYIWATH